MTAQRAVGSGPRARNPSAEALAGPATAPVLTLRRWGTVVLSLGALLVVAIIVCTSIGAADVPFGEIVRAILGRSTGRTATIIRDVRLPRVLTGAVVGGSLAAAGVTFQALLRNPLADPYILGVSGGGAVGAILAILMGAHFSLWGFSAVTVCAFLGAVGTIALVYTVAHTGGRLVTHSLLLAGVIANAIYGALIMFMVTILDYTRVQSVLYWLMGSLGAAEPNVLPVLVLYIGVGLVGLLMLARDMNLLALGEESAATLGVAVERTKLLAFVGASLITGASVSVSGLIGFVGLIIPHAVRMVIGVDHRLLLPASVLAGAIFLMIADSLARVVLSPSELPVGVLTALCGGPFFIWLLRARTRATGGR